NLALPWVVRFAKIGLSFLEVTKDCDWLKARPGPRLSLLRMRRQGISVPSSLGKRSISVAGVGRRILTLIRDNCSTPRVNIRSPVLPAARWRALLCSLG